MDKSNHKPKAVGTPKATASGDRPVELAEFVSSLEQSLERADALGLTLVAALLDHALVEARRAN